MVPPSQAAVIPGGCKWTSKETCEVKPGRQWRAWGQGNRPVSWQAHSHWPVNLGNQLEVVGGGSWPADHSRLVSALGPALPGPCLQLPLLQLEKGRGGGGRQRSQYTPNRHGPAPTARLLELCRGCTTSQQDGRGSTRTFQLRENTQMLKSGVFPWDKRSNLSQTRGRPMPLLNGVPGGRSH